MLACYLAYDLSRALAQGREAIAMANGIYFMNLEKALGIWWEPWIQGRVSAVEPLMTSLVWVYQYVTCRSSSAPWSGCSRSAASSGLSTATGSWR